MFARTLNVETQLDKILQIASVFPVYAAGREYAANDVFSYGVNAVGDPQLYQVLQAHTSAEEWAPDATPSLYKKIGITTDGYPEWVQPLGATDAYNTGDVVSYGNTLYRSTIDGNIWRPDIYPAGWEVYTDEPQEQTAEAGDASDG